MARQANRAAARLVRGLKQRPDVRIIGEPRANIVFADWPRAAHRHLHDAGAQYYVWSGELEGPDDELLTARLVADWSVSDESIDRFLTLTGRTGRLSAAIFRVSHPLVAAPAETSECAAKMGVEVVQAILTPETLVGIGNVERCAEHTARHGFVKV